MDVKVLLSEYKTVDIPDKQIINFTCKIIRKKYDLPKNIIIREEKIFKVVSNVTSHTWTSDEFYRNKNDVDDMVIDILTFLDKM